MASKAKTDTKLWEALSCLDDDLLNPSVPDAAIDDELEALGIDAKGLAERSAASVERLLEKRRLSWQTTASQRRAKMERRAAGVEVSARMDRASILARLDELRAADARLGTAIKMAARKRKPEESTDDELRALLREMEVLRALEEDDTK